MSVVDDIEQFHIDREFDGDIITARLNPDADQGNRLALIVGVDADGVERAAISIDISTCDQGPLISILAFSADGKPADLARMEWGSGSLMLHVITPE